MKVQRILKVLALASAAAFAALLLNCGTLDQALAWQGESQTQRDDEAWTAATKENTIDAYEGFIIAHPHSMWVGDAHERIDGLRFEKAQQQDTIEGYGEFERSAKSERYRYKADDAAFALAEKAGTEESYQKYLDNCFLPPDASSHQVVARKQLEEFAANAAKRDFQAAKSTNTVQTWTAFIKQHPDSAFVNDAKNLLYELVTRPQIERLRSQLIAKGWAAQLLDGKIDFSAADPELQEIRLVDFLFLVEADPGFVDVSKDFDADRRILNVDIEMDTGDIRLMFRSSRT